MGLLRMLQAQLFWVTGVLGQGLSIAHITGQLLTLLGLEEARLVSAAVELGAAFSKVLLVLIVTLESADTEEMPHPWVIIDAAEPNL